MNTKSKFILITILLFVLAVCSAVLASCINKGGENGSEENVDNALIKAGYKGYGQGGVFIKPEDFENVKNDWYGKDSHYLLSDKANAAICGELLAGEKYYFVYTLNIPYSELPPYSGTQVVGRVSTYRGYINFCISRADGTSVLSDAFNIGESFCDSQSTVYSTKFAYLAKNSPYALNIGITGSQDVKTYVAVEVTPKVAGAAFVQFNWIKTVLNNEYEQPCEHVACASVKNAAEPDAEDKPVTVNSLKYSIVSGKDYPNGSIPDGYDGTAAGGATNTGSLFIGDDYYLVADFEVNNNGSAHTYGAAMFFTETSYVHANLQQANSGNFYSADFVHGTLINVGYTIAEDTENVRKARIIINISPLQKGKCPVYILIYNSDSSVNGSNYLFLNINVSVQSSSEESSVLKYQYGDSFYTVTGRADNSVAEIVIPDEYNGLPVKIIGASAFYHPGGVDITKVTIGNGVNSIGIYAFKSNAIEEVVMGENVSSIAKEAFYGNNIKSLTLSQRLREIGARAFMYNKITQLNLPPFLEEIGDEAFYGNSFDSVFIPASVKSIGENAFDSKVKITVSPDNPYYTVEDGVLKQKTN